jgi:hypothetical protein
MSRSTHPASEESKAATVATLSSLLEGSISVIEAARKLSSLRFSLVGDQLDDDWRVFVGIDSETDHLPVGEVRKHWSADALAAKDAESQKTEEFYRDHALTAARSLLHRYAPKG